VELVISDLSENWVEQSSDLVVPLLRASEKPISSSTQSVSQPNGLPMLLYDAFVSSCFAFVAAIDSAVGSVGGAR
jgi:hypothetical protein